jgi:F0F1-type ATP synthase assembly protein I
MVNFICTQKRKSAKAQKRKSAKAQKREGAKMLSSCIIYFCGFETWREIHFLPLFIERILKY